tara:strand:+ start:110 stop:232 length:123 start_codon:yes stop_codon:yes gene_type:complete
MLSPTAATLPVTLGGRVLTIIEKAVNLTFNTLTNHWWLHM